MSTVTRAEVCVAACAEAWRGDGEIAASPMGVVPSIAARLARATFEPDLLLSDGEAGFVVGTWAVGTPPPAYEGPIPFRSVFDFAWAGRRHVMMGASQVDRYGNTNISTIGEFSRPKSALLGVRGAPGNTINHPTSYWVGKHSPRVFVERVDMVSGIGYDRAAALPNGGGRFHEIRRVVTNLAVLDFETPDRRMRLRSVHPGVTAEQVQEATGFELAGVADATPTPEPDDEALALIRELIDPKSLRDLDVSS